MQTRKICLPYLKNPECPFKDYLEWEPQQDLRHEYINGEVFAMTGGTLAHNDITLNLYRTLYPQVRSPITSLLQ